MPHNRVLLDSDAVIGWLVETDTHHARATELFEFLFRQRMKPVVTNLMIAECVTWLSAMVSQDIARQFLRESERLDVIFITPEIHAETATLFHKSSRRRTSYIDYSNYFVMRAHEIAVVFSFDHVYSSEFELLTLQQLYEQSKP